MARIGIDIGGTFTDLIASGRDGRVLATCKLASTPDDPARAAMQGAEQLLRKAGLNFGDVEFCCHGTTVATNALLERKGTRTGLITTRGFRDVLHIGRKDRPYNFSHYQEIARQSRPLAPRRWRMTVRERIRAPNGEVEVPLNEEDVLEAVARLKEQGVEAVAVCCLFSFLNPEHEQRIAEIGRQNVITLDVGGTSADIGVAPNGEMRMRSLLDTKVGEYDVMTPMVDIATLGAGGGSIAWLDEQGMFRVGPHSAGADPGPACYGKGGQRGQGL